MTYQGICEFCNREVATSETGAYRVRGWEPQRQAGGANQIIGRERQPNRIVHLTCVQIAIRKERKGLRDQESLI